MGSKTSRFFIPFYLFFCLLLPLKAGQTLEELAGDWLMASFLIVNGERHFGDVERVSIDEAGRIEIHRNEWFPFLEEKDGKVGLRQDLMAPGATGVQQPVFSWMDEPEGVVGFIISTQEGSKDRNTGQELVAQILTYFYALPPAKDKFSDWEGLWINESHSTSSRLFVDKIAINDQGDKLSYFQRNPSATFHPIAPGHVLYRISSTAAVMQYHLDEPYLRFRLKKFHSYVRDTPTDESIVFRRMTEEEAERERVFLNLRNLRIAFQETWRDAQRGGYANALLDKVKTSDRIFVPGPETYGVRLAGGEEKRFSLNEEGHFPEGQFFLPEDAEALFAEGDFADSPLTLSLPH